MNHKTTRPVTKQDLPDEDTLAELLRDVWESRIDDTSTMFSGTALRAIIAEIEDEINSRVLSTGFGHVMTYLPAPDQSTDQEHVWITGDHTVTHNGNQITVSVDGGSGSVTICASDAAKVGAALIAASDADYLNDTDILARWLMEAGDDPYTQAEMILDRIPDAVKRLS